MRILSDLAEMFSDNISDFIYLRISISNFLSIATNSCFKYKNTLQQQIIKLTTLQEQTLELEANSRIRDIKRVLLEVNLAKSTLLV